MQTMQQRRAKHALEGVEAAKQSGVSQKEYKSYASSFPAMIQMNGLGQAAAFYRSKGAEDNPKGKAYKALYDLLSGWLSGPGQPYYESSDLLTGITRQDMHAYRLAQAEALALLGWVKKFAKAFMEDNS
jgi:CRISPR-associated protein Cmr5